MSKKAELQKEMSEVANKLNSVLRGVSELKPKYLVKNNSVKILSIVTELENGNSIDGSLCSSPIIFNPLNSRSSKLHKSLR